MLQKPIYLAALLVAATFLFSASARAELRKWRVDHYLQPNSNAGPGRLCYVISDGAAAQLFDQPILGFAWEWGTVYQITVNVDQARAADGSLVKTCKLVSVDSQSRVREGTRFQMYLFDKSFIQDKTLLGVKPFQCATAGVEAELKRRLDNLAGKGAIPCIPGNSPSTPAAKQRDLPDETPHVLLEFSHPKTPSEPLILHGITLASDLGLE
ncbi:MAG: hypothetical protein IAF94_01710 [Pirellulaceae bacterium]|nr:hypothetical protein [Pirellulaceae bacterium]